MEENKNFQFNSSSSNNSGGGNYSNGSYNRPSGYGGSSTPSGYSSSGGTNGAPKGPSNDKDENLRRLQQQLNRNTGEEEQKKRKRRFIIWFFIILLLVGLAGVGIYFFLRGSGGSLDLGHTIRLSVDMEDHSASEESKIEVKTIYPGNAFPVEISVRNANNYSGDSEHLDVVPIFVRFKIELRFDSLQSGLLYDEYCKHKGYIASMDEYNKYSEGYSNTSHIIVPTVQSANWTWDEDGDGFYYFNSRLESQENIILFSGISFDFHNTKNWMAGERATIIITAEAVEGNANNIGEGEAWGSAPERWINDIKARYGA